MRRSLELERISTAGPQVGGASSRCVRARSACFVGRRRAGVAVVLCVCALAVVSPAPAANNPAYPGSVLNVTTSGTPVVGSELTIVATGTNQPILSFSYNLALFAVDHDRLSGACPQDYGLMLTIFSTHSGTGIVSLLTLPGGLNEGLSGPFNLSLPVPVRRAGHLLICAYSVASGDTAAWASTELTLTGKATPKPTSTLRPRVTQSGHRLRCSRGSWSGAPTSYAYRWRVSRGRGVAGQGSSLTVTRGLQGRAVACSVTATNAGGSTTVTSVPFKIH